MIPLEFWITAFIVVIAPGTGVVYTIAIGLGRGRAASVAAALGCTIGIVPHMSAAILGFAAILHTSAVLFQGFKLLGAAYLVYLAIQTLRDRGALRFNADKAAKTPWQTARTGFLINILNPKLSIFFLAFLPQFFPSGTPDALGHMLVLSAIFMAMTLVVFVVYGVFAAAARTYVLSSERALGWMRRATALAFGAMAARLALSEV